MGLGHLKVSREIELAGLVESLTVWGEYRHETPALPIGSASVFYFSLVNQGVIGLNDRGSDCHEKERNENKQNEGRNHLDGGLGGLLFRTLAASGAQRVRVNAQGLRHAGAKTIGLDQRAHQRFDIVHSGALDQVAQGLGTGLAGTHFK